MNRSLALLCLIRLDRSRVVILSLARYRNVFILQFMNYYIQDGRYGMGDRIGEGVAPSVSIKDRSVVGCADQGLNCTNRMPGVGGSRSR